MRVFAVAVALGLVLSASSSYAQDPDPPDPVVAPAAPQSPAESAPRFQDGLRYAFIDVQRIASESTPGRVATDKIKALQDQKVRELQDRQKSLQGDQERLESTGSVLSDQARIQLQREIERKQLDLQRFSEDAQDDVTALTQQLQMEFEQQLVPVIDRIAREKQLHMVFNVFDSGLIWAEPGMDLTAEIIQALNAGGN
jgi:outer membrane protein